MTLKPIQLFGVKVFNLTLLHFRYLCASFAYFVKCFILTGGGYGGRDGGSSGGGGRYGGDREGGYRLVKVFRHIF